MLKKIFLFIWRHRIILSILIILLGLFVWLRASQQPREKPSSREVSSQAVYKSIRPGESKLDALTKELGQPLKEKQEGGRKILEFQSTNSFRPHQVTVEGETVVLVKEMVNYDDEKKAQDIKKEYGEASYKLFDQTSYNSSFYLFVYPQKGIAYLGHDDGTLLEILYFKPTSTADFIKNWAPNYSLEKPEPIQ